MPKEKDALDIINDKSNFTDAASHLGADSDSEMTGGPRTAQAEPPSQEKGISRRSLLKIGGVGAVVASLAGAGAAGFAIGRSDDAYTGYNRTYQGGDMFFNRKPFRVKTAAMMEPVGPVERPNWTEFLFDRRGEILRLIKSGEWNPGMGLEKMPGDLGDYYRSRPREDYDTMMSSLEKAVKRTEAWKNGKNKRYAIADAYNSAFRAAGMYNRHGSTVPEDPADVERETGNPVPPEEWDFRKIWRDKPLPFKSPKHASQLIKRVAHMFGMSLVGITDFDPRFMFKNKMRGMPNGGREWGDKVPAHWKSVILMGVPMYWDNTYAAIGYSSSFDAYFRSRCAAGLMEQFLHELGYPARAMFPGTHYEIMMAPFLLKAGLGEYSRAGVVMTPETGLNIRPAAVVTNIEFEYDQPISINMAEFCKKCKICADVCPSGAISKADEPDTVVRGFRRWRLDEEKCYNQWSSGPTSDGFGCRVCIGACPFSRKNTWIHTISRELEPRDPTGLTATGLLAMQHNFFKYPEAEDFKSDWDGGKEANYHNPLWWMRPENFFDLEKNWEYYGME